MTERSTGEYVRLATDKDGEDARDGSRALTVIEPGRGWALHLGDLWPYRELLYFLVWRDIKVRYKQTAIGALWAVLQPVALTLVFTLFFGNLRGISPEGVPYCTLRPFRTRPMDALRADAVTRVR